MEPRAPCSSEMACCRKSKEGPEKGGKKKKRVREANKIARNKNVFFFFMRLPGEKAMFIR